MENNRFFSVVVVGGGLAGSISAMQLARAGVNVAIIERSNYRRRRIGETCGPSLRQFLRNHVGLEIPPRLECSFEYLWSAWGTSLTHCEDFSFWQADNGSVLDRPAFDKWLLDRAVEAGAELWPETTVQSAKEERDGWTIKAVTEGKTTILRAGFVIEATGRTTLRVFCRDSKRIFVDKLVAVWCECDSAEDPAVMVEACELGWWYRTPLPSGRDVVAFFTDSDLLPERSKLISYFTAAFQQTIHVAQISHDSICNLPLTISDARTYIRRILWRDRWCCIGDSACSIDPLSGSGILRALQSGADAAVAVNTWLRSGEFEVLRSFALNQGKMFLSALPKRIREYSLERRWPEAQFWKRRLELKERSPSFN